MSFPLLAAASAGPVAQGGGGEGLFGELSQDAETPEQIALFLPLLDDELDEAYVASVRFRESPAGDWEDADDLWRLKPELAGAPPGGGGQVVIAEGFAGTIYDLSPGQSYDVEVLDSEDNVIGSGTFATRSLPRAASGTPVIVTTQAELIAAFDSAEPGMVIQIPADTTITLTGAVGPNLGESGTEADPVFVRGENRATSKIFRATVGALIEFVANKDYYVVENMTLEASGIDHPSDTGVINFPDLGGAGAVGCCFRELTITGANKGIRFSDWGSNNLVYDCTLSGNNVWNSEFTAGWDEDLEGVVASVTPSAGGEQELTLLLTELLPNKPARLLTFDCAANETARTFTITGLSLQGVTEEEVQGANASTRNSVNHWYEISSITVDDDTAGAISVGWEAGSNNSTWNDDGVTLSGTGNCVFNCTFYDFGDTVGFGTGSTEDINNACYVFRCKIFRAGDDGIEGEYTHRNIGVYDNYILNSATGFSFDGNYCGPLDFFRNRIINHYRQPLKCGSVTSGVRVRGNTFVKGTGPLNNISGLNFWYWAGPIVIDWELRNNLFLYETDLTETSNVGKALLFDKPPANWWSPVTWTHNGWGRDGRAMSFQEASGNVATVNAALTPILDGDIEITDQAAVFGTTVVLGANYLTEITTEYTLALKSSSEAENAGVLIPNINPSGDLGAYGFGETPPVVGDRS